MFLSYHRTWTKESEFNSKQSHLRSLQQIPEGENNHDRMLTNVKTVTELSVMTVTVTLITLMTFLPVKKVTVVNVLHRAFSL